MESSAIQEELAHDVLEDDINFDEIDDDLDNLENDELIQQALHRGVDLKKYASELEKDLRMVSLSLSHLYCLLQFMLDMLFDNSDDLCINPIYSTVG